MVRISKRSVDSNNAERPSIYVLQGPSNTSPLSQCCGNSRWNRILIILFAFSLGAIMTALEVFPDLKQLFAAEGNNEKSEMFYENEDEETETPKVSQAKFALEVKEGDHSNIVNKIEKKRARNPERDGDKFRSAECHYECKTDRLGHKMPLYPGQALCNQPQRFGLAESGDFLLHDCETGEKKVFWSAASGNHSHIHFEMKKDGRFQIISEQDKVLFQEQPKRTISYSKQCLDDPTMDCPYLHLRKSGMVVVNWQDEDTGEWMDRDMEKTYLTLYP